MFKLETIYNIMLLTFQWSDDDGAGIDNLRHVDFNAMVFVDGPLSHVCKL